MRQLVTIKKKSELSANKLKEEREKPVKKSKKALSAVLFLRENGGR